MLKFSPVSGTGVPPVRHAQDTRATYRLTHDAPRWILRALLMGCFLIGSIVAFAGETIVWEMSSRAELLKGEAHGVSVTDAGTLMLAPRFTQLFDTTQAYIWSSAIDSA